MKKNTLAISLILTAVLFLSCSYPGGPAKTNSPNIIYILLDEWGYYEWSAMNHHLIETPNIDIVASEGMRFTQLLAGGCVCAPTRSTLMTGQHTGQTTVRANKGGNSLCEDDITIARVLSDAGYATGGFGKWGLGDLGTSGVPERQGFDVFYGYYHQAHAHSYYPKYLIKNSVKIPLKGNPGHAYKGETFSQYLIHDEAKKFIKENAGEKPFFAYLPYTPPHAFYGIPDNDPSYLKYKDKDWDAPPHHTDSKVSAGDEAQRYAALMNLVDRQIGEILDLLKELNIDDNTILIVSGDNGGAGHVFTNEKYPHSFFKPNVNPNTGEYFRGRKGNLYEGGLRVAFMARWPGKIKPGTISDHLGYFPDILPTFAEIARAKTPDNINGISILPELLGKKNQKDHECLYWEYIGWEAVRVDNWKAVKPPNSNEFELYNLSNDISEQNNIASKHPDMIRRIKEYAKEAQKPERKGTVYDKDAAFNLKEDYYR